MFKTLKLFLSRNGQHGFSLVELAIVMLIAGLLIGAAITAIRPVVTKVQYETTEKSMTKLNRALAAYALRHNRLPCPADPNPGTEPFGAERGSGSSGTNYGSCTGAGTVGLVPFRALGLSEDDVKDGWKRYITYRVTPAFAVNTSAVDETTQNTIHARCRSPEWVEEGEGSEGSDEFEFKKEDFPENYADQSPTFRHTLENDVTFELSVSDEGGWWNENSDLPPKLTWYEHTETDPDTGEEHHYAGVGMEGRPEPWSDKIYQSTIDLSFIDEADKDGDGDTNELSPTEDVSFVLDDVSNNVGEDKSIVFQVHFINESGHDDYFWHEVQLEDDPSPSSDPLSPATHSWNGGKAVYREKLTPDNYLPGGLLSLNVVSDHYVKDDGTPLLNGPSITKITLHTDPHHAYDEGFVADTGYHAPHFNYSSLAIAGVKAGSATGGGEDKNINPAKARFCCPINSGTYGDTADIRVLDSSGGNALVDVDRSVTNSSDYGDKDSIETGTIDKAETSAVAYALISHGPNGHGAYLANGTGNTYVATEFGADEVENIGALNPTDPDIVYRETDRTDDNTYFDDIVVWRTQDQVYAEFSSDTCTQP